MNSTSQAMIVNQMAVAFPIVPHMGRGCAVMIRLLLIWHTANSWLSIERNGSMDKHYAEMLESRINGNITDFNNRVKKLTKKQIGDFLMYIIDNCSSPYESLRYLQKALQSTQKG